MADIMERDDEKPAAKPEVRQEAPAPADKKTAAKKPARPTNPPSEPPTPRANPALVSQASPAVPAEARHGGPDTGTYEVVRNARVLWRGQQIRLRAGQRVNSSSYGPGCIERFRSAGVALSPVAK